MGPAQVRAFEQKELPVWNSNPARVKISQPLKRLEQDEKTNTRRPLPRSLLRPNQFHEIWSVNPVPAENSGWPLKVSSTAHVTMLHALVLVKPQLDFNADVADSLAPRLRGHFREPQGGVDSDHQRKPPNM